MKKTTQKQITAAWLGVLSLVVCCPLAHADLVGSTYSVSSTVSTWVTNWPSLLATVNPAVTNLSPQYTSLANANLVPAGNFSAAGQPSANGGAVYTEQGETFTPNVPFRLAGVAVMAGNSAGAAGSTVNIIMRLFDVTATLTSNNGSTLNGSGATYPAGLTDLLGNGNGLTFAWTNNTGNEQQEFFALTNGPTSSDQVMLTNGHTYALEFWSPVSGTANAFLVYKSATADAGGQEMGSHDAQAAARLTLVSLGQAGGAPRTFAIALYSATNAITPGAVTNPITTLANPVPAVYGPPTVWPYTAGVTRAPSDAANVDEAFGANTVMGETFTAPRDFLLRNFYFALRGSATSGNYVLVLRDLGVAGTTTYGNTLNPAPFANSIVGNANLTSNLLAHPSSPFPLYWSFSPTGITNTTIVKFKLAFGDQVRLTNGHSYFLGFAAAGGNNDMVLERTTNQLTDLGGAAYKGSATSVANNGFGPAPVNFLYAVDVLNPNLAFNVTNAPLDVTWPNVPGALNGGQPMLDTYDDPSTEGGLLDESQNTAVSEGFGPSTSTPGLALTMSFYATNTFNLGAIAIRERGLGSSNCLFTVNIYNITNTYYSQTNTIEKWPRNYQPNIDCSPRGTPVTGTNLDFYYTADNGVNGAGQGTNDQFLVLTLKNPGLITLVSNQVYAIEITADTVGQNALTDGLMLWTRDVGQGPFEYNYMLSEFPGSIAASPTIVNLPSPFDGSIHPINPKAMTRNYTDPENFAGGLVGADSPRLFIMAVYGVNPPPIPTSVRITSVTRTGNTVNLTWAPTPTGSFTYTVRYKLNLTDATWTTLQSGITGTTYPDTTATPTQRFYQVTSP